MSPRRLPWLLAVGLGACAGPGPGLGVGPRGAVLSVRVGEAFARGRSEPLPAFAERLARLGRERAGLQLAVVVGACPPVDAVDHAAVSSSRRLASDRAQAVAARLRAAGCPIGGVMVVTDDRSRDGVLEVFAGSPR